MPVLEERCLLALALIVARVANPTSARASEPPLAPEPGADERRFGVGGDVLAVVPVGSFADVSGPLFGPVVRVGYYAQPWLELTLRTGYLFALTKDLSVPAGAHSASGYGVTAGLSDLPIWAGTRAFVLRGRFGAAYVGAELGVNLLVGGGSATAREGQSVGLTSLEVSHSPSARPGFDVGVGYVAPNVPIHVGAAVTAFNVFGRETNPDEPLLVGATLNVGYEAKF